MLVAYRYLPMLLLLLLALVIPAVLVAVASLSGLKKSTPAKMKPFECGNDPAASPRKRFSVQFFLVALLFIIFDVETVFIFPWAVIFRKLGLYGFIEMSVFLFMLILGLFYAWKKGALEWE